MSCLPDVISSLRWSPNHHKVDPVLQAFSKCGVIKEDDQRRPRIKIYRDRESGMPKGDGLVTYLKDPSVSLKPFGKTIKTH